MSRLIVCERRGTWAAALRAELGDRAGELRQTRGRDDCWQELRAAPTSLVIFELDPARGAEALEALLRLAWEFPRAAAIVVGPRGSKRWEQAARELGAIWFIASPRRLAELRPLMKRFFDAQPLDRRGLREQIAARLPWGKTNAE